MGLGMSWNNGRRPNRYVRSVPFGKPYEAPTQEVSDWLRSTEKLANQEAPNALEGLTRDAMESLEDLSWDLDIPLDD